MKKQTLAAAAIGLVTMLGVGGATMAAQAESATPAPTASASAAPGQPGAHDQNGQPDQGHRGPRGTEISGDELTKVADAVKAKDSSITVEHAMKESDGTYRVMAQKSDGTKIGYDVTADLATATQHQFGQRPDGEQPGQGERGPRGTEVTGDELTKVADAVKAKDSTVTVEHVMKESDGTYRVMAQKSDGTKSGFDVSADLGTIEAKTFDGKGPGGGHGPDGKQGTEVTGDEAQKVINAVQAKDSSVTIDKVMKSQDGSYDALGKKADGGMTMFSVSADLGTITAR